MIAERGGIALAALVALGAAAVCGGSARAAGDCWLQDERTLRLVGATDDAMRTCVEAAATADVDRLVVTSAGGDALTAMEIGDLLVRPALHVVVDHECNSSCANYFLPLASRITLRPGSMVLLHGGMDPGFVKQGVAQEPLLTANLEMRVAHQDDFAERHGVPLGWLLYREDYADRAFGAHLEGEAAWSAPSARMVLVEEALLRSCLSQARIDPLEDTLAQRAGRDALLRNRLVRMGVAASGSLRCVGNDAGEASSG